MKIKIKVHPTSGKREIMKKSDDEFEVYLKSAPENNKANIELVKMVNKYFGREIKIVAGKNSKKKIVEIG